MQRIMMMGRLGRTYFPRGLASTVGSQAGKDGVGMGVGGGVKEPVISLSKGEVLRRPENDSSPRLLSYYLDTHSVVLQLQDEGYVITMPHCMLKVVFIAGYSLQQAEGLVKVLSHTLQRAVTPLERSVLSQRDLVKNCHYCARSTLNAGGNTTGLDGGETAERVGRSLWEISASRENLTRVPQE